MLNSMNTADRPSGIFTPEMKLQKNGLHSSPFLRFQKIIKKSVLKYKSILNARKISRMKANYSGKIYVQFCAESGFQMASVEIYRMLLKGRVKTNQTQANIKKKEPKFKNKSEQVVRGSNRGFCKEGKVAQLGGRKGGSFELFLPEYMMEMIPWTPKATSASMLSDALPPLNIIRLTNIQGRKILVRGETQLKTFELWHFFYNKSVQTTLPNYIGKVERAESDHLGRFVGSGFSRKTDYRLVNPGVEKSHQLIELPLKNKEEVFRVARKWLFDVNLDLIENLVFERTSGVFLTEDRLVLCRSKFDIAMKKFVFREIKMGNPELLIQNLERILFILRNLQHRNVFISPEFDLEDIAIFGDEVYFRGIERLQMRPESFENEQIMLLSFLDQLRGLEEFVDTRKLKNPQKRNIKVLREAKESLRKTNQPLSLQAMINHFRQNLDLEGHKNGSSSKEEGKFLGQNSLDLNLAKNEIRRKEPPKAENDYLGSISTLLIGDEGVVENHLARTLETRAIQFKNKFICNKKTK